MKKIIKILFSVLLFFIIAGAGIFLFIVIQFDGFKYFHLGKTISPQSIPFAMVFEDRNGIEFFRSFGNQNREWVDKSKIPKILLDATLMAEDKRFYSHNGIDFQGIARAMKENFAAGYIKQGGSTITQQIAKKAFLTDERSFDRKFKELFLSFGIEQVLTKDEILEMYVNIAPYGATLSGIKSSADFYFNKSVEELSETESFILSVLPKDPVRLSRKTRIIEWSGSCSNTKKCTIFSTDFIPKRLDSILLAVAEKNNWSEQKILSIWTELRQTQLPNKQSWVNDDFQHFRFYVINFLQEQGLNLENFPGGLRIKTSIDIALQKELLQYLRSPALIDLTTKNGMKNNAVLLLDNKNRKPIVWIGSRDFWNEDISGQVDLLTSLRQTGSAIKPFVFNAFFNQGFGPLTTMWDTRVKFNGESKIIQNSDGRYLGGVPAYTSLAHSRNVPAAQALYLAGGEKKARSYFDNSFGFEINKNHKNHGFGWSLALGTAPIELKNLANGFATLATGKRQEICPILELKTMTEKTLTDICPKNIWKINDITRFFTLKSLSNPLLRPEGPWRDNTTLEGKEIAIKSGTSSKKIYGELYPVDNYLIGTNPAMTFLLWGGNTNGENMEQGTFGTTALGPHWKKMMEFVFKKQPWMSEEFSVPVGVESEGPSWKRIGKSIQKFKKINGMTYVSQEENKTQSNQKSGIEIFIEDQLSTIKK